MSITTGARYRASNSSLEVVIVKAPAEGDEPLLCDGVEMTTEATEPGAGAQGEQLLLGKRYSAPGLGLEVLCVTAGPGPLSLGTEPLGEQQAKALPASD